MLKPDSTLFMQRIHSTTSFTIVFHKVIAFVALVLCTFHLTLDVSQAQTLTVITRNPMPSSLTEWQRDRSLIQVIIVNPPGSPEKRNCRLSYILKEAGSGKVIAQSENNNPSLPRFTIPAGPSTVTRFGNDIVIGNATSFDQSIRTKVITTNSIPEGDFDFCVSLLDENGNVVGESGGLCRFFTVIIPDPPTLIAPQHNQSLVHGTLPVFSWTPVIGASLSSIKYSIKICPVFKGQNDRFAIDNNPTLHEKRGLDITSYMYPPSGLQPNSYAGAVGFVWQVQALDKNGLPATRNYGKSEIFRYTFRNVKDIDNVSNNDSTGIMGNAGNGNAGRRNNDAVQWQSGGTSGSKYFTTIRIGSYTLSLREPIQAKNDNVYSGTAKGVIPFFNDSIVFQCEGVRYRVMNNTLVAYDGRASYSWTRKALTSEGFSLYPTSVYLLHDNSIIEGDIGIDWSSTGLKGVNSRLNFYSSFSDKGIKETSVSLNERFYIDNSSTNCLYLQCDTVTFSYTFSDNSVLKGDVRGAVYFDCLRDDQKSLGRVSIPLNNPSSDNLLFTLQTQSRALELKGTPIIMKSGTFWVDFSSEANFAGVKIQPYCAMTSANNPQWKGIVLPECTTSIKLGDTPFEVGVKDVIVDVKESKVSASFVSVSSVGQNTNIGGFNITVDSAYISLCRNNPIEVKYTSILHLGKSGFEVPPSFKIFNKLPLLLEQGGSWNVRGRFLFGEQGEDLVFGNKGTLTVKKGVLFNSTKDVSVIRLYSNTLKLSPEKNVVIFPDIYIKGNGTVGLSESEWKVNAKRVNTTFENYGIELAEFGFGYTDKTFWLGFSGDLLPPIESGLSKIPLTKLKIYANEKSTTESQRITTDFKVGGTLSGTMEVGWSSSKGMENGGIIGEGTITVPWLSKEKIPFMFSMGSEKDIPFWYMRTQHLFEDGREMVKDFNVRAITLSTGWNTQFEEYGKKVLEDLLNGGELPTNRSISTVKSDFFCKGLLIAGDKTLNSVRSYLRFNHSMANKPGTLGSTIEANGLYAYLPSLSFAKGTVKGQWSALQKPSEITLLGDFTISIDEMNEVSTHGHVTYSSKGLNATFGSFNTLFKGANVTDKSGITSFTALACEGCYWDVSGSSLKLRSATKVFTGIGGVPMNQQVPITIVSINDGNDVCMNTSLSNNDDKKTLTLRFGINQVSNVFVSFDVFSCLSNISLLSYSSLNQLVQSDNNSVQLSTVSNNKCQPLTLLSADAQCSSVTEVSFISEPAETSLRFGDKSISFNKITMPKRSIGSYIAGSFSGKNLESEFGTVSNRKCGENSSLQQKTNTIDELNIAVEKNGDYYFVNHGSDLRKETKVKFIYKLEGGTKTIEKVVRISRNVKNGEKIPLRTLTNTSSRSSFVMASVYFVVEKETKLDDNCFSEDSSLCR